MRGATVKLRDLTQEEIRDFAGETIFGRGYGYYKDDMVYEFDYNPSTDGILAEVHGNYGDYEVGARHASPLLLRRGK